MGVYGFRVEGLGVRVQGLEFKVEGFFFENNYFTEMCSGSEAGSYLRLLDVVYHSTLGLRVIKKKRFRVYSVSPAGMTVI